MSFLESLLADDINCYIVDQLIYCIEKEEQWVSDSFLVLTKNNITTITYLYSPEEPRESMTYETPTVLEFIRNYVKNNY